MEIKENVWVVTVEEHDRFSGPQLFERRKFTDENEAQAYADSFNKKNTSKEVPDWYLTAMIEKI